MLKDAGPQGDYTGRLRTRDVGNASLQDVPPTGRKDAWKRVSQQEELMRFRFRLLDPVSRVRGSRLVTVNPENSEDDASRRLLVDASETTMRRWQRAQQACESCPGCSIDRFQLAGHCLLVELSEVRGA